MRVCLLCCVLLVGLCFVQTHGRRAKSLLSDSAVPISSSRRRTLYQNAELPHVAERRLGVESESSLSDGKVRHSAFAALDEVTVWKATFLNSELEMEGSDWKPGYMLLKKASDWKIPAEFGAAMEECFLEQTRETGDTSRTVESTQTSRTANRTSSHSHKVNQSSRHLQEKEASTLRSEPHPEEQDNKRHDTLIENGDRIDAEDVLDENVDVEIRVVNATLCPTFDISLQVVNSIVTRAVFLPDGNIVPFDVVATDYVGSLENMEKESQLLDVLTLLESMDIMTVSDSQPQRLILRGPLASTELTHVEGCGSISCYARHIFSNCSSFWSVESIVGPDGEWISNSMPGAGVWIQFDDMSDDNATMMLIPDVMGGDIDDGVSITFSIASGNVKDSQRLSDGDGLHYHVIEILQEISQNLESLSFDLTDIPFMLNLKEHGYGKTNSSEGLSQARAVSLYSSYFGDLL